MSDGVTPDEKVLSEVAISRQASIDPDAIARQTNNLLTVLGWVFGGPPLLSRYSLAAVLDLPPLTAVKGYISYYKIHLTILARVLASVSKAGPVDAEIRELETNVGDYVAKARDFASRVRSDIPPTPWTRMPAATGLMIILGADALRRNARFVTEWNLYLGIYQVLVENAVEAAKYLSSEGDQIVRESPVKLQELREAVDAVEARISLDWVIKYRYKERIDWIEIDLLPRVRTAAAVARDTAAYLERGPLTQVRQAQRL